MSGMIVSDAARTRIEANRARYLELKAAGQGSAPRALPPPTPRDGARIAEASVIVRETVPAGWYWTTPLKRGEALRLVNVEGISTASLVAWRADDVSERLNYADTVKIQWSATLRKGRVLFSDMGRVMLSIVEDSAGAHDAIVGGSSAASNAERYGAEPQRNTRDNFIAAALKLGLSKQDIPPCVAFFAPVGLDAAGGFTWDPGRRHAGDFVDLRAEMDLVVALSNCPHPLDPAPTWTAGPLDVVRFRAPPAAADDLCRTATAEAVRGFENTDALLAG